MDAQEGQVSRAVQEYAAQYGVTTDEALRRFELQRQIGQLNANLEQNEQPTFAGLWLEHNPEFRIIVRFTHSGEQTIAKYLTGSALAALVRVEAADVSMEGLQQILSAAFTAVTALGYQANGNIDVKTNKAEILVVDSIAVRAAVARGALRLPDHAVVKGVAALLKRTADIYGGLIPAPECTLGFSVRTSSGTRGVVTAGHCAGNDARRYELSYNGISLPWQNGRNDSYYDVQWHTAPQFTVRNWVFDGRSNVPITASTGRSSQFVGEAVCHYGKATGFGCGTIQSKNIQPDGAHTATFVAVRDTQTGKDLSSDGDSGGPWFRDFDKAAYGVMIGELYTKDAVYMPVDYLSGIGVSLLLQ